MLLLSESEVPDSDFCTSLGFEKYFNIKMSSKFSKWCDIFKCYTKSQQIQFHEETKAILNKLLMHRNHKIPFR